MSRGETAEIVVIADSADFGTSVYGTGTLARGDSPGGGDVDGLAGSAAPSEATTASRGARMHEGSAAALEERPGGRPYAPWGMLAAIDLHSCLPARLANPETIRAFVPAVIDAIGMRAHGPLAIERFGDGDLEGWSAMQFIETSSITIHADEVFGRCFVDVFSCRPFGPDAAAGIAVAHFGGTATVTTLRR